MIEEFNFLEEIENCLDKQFPKGKCKERGNALVLYAMVNLKFEEFIKKLKEGIHDFNEMETGDKGRNDFINKLAGRKLVEGDRE